MLALPAAPAACMSNFGLNRFSCYFVQTSTVLFPPFHPFKGFPLWNKIYPMSFPETLTISVPKLI